MSKTGASISQQKAAPVDMKFEIVVIPVSDVDRAKEFYAKLGWRLDADHAAPGGDFRVIQFTPPGSGCSVIFGKNVTAAAPGSAQGLYLIVSDIEAARRELLESGVEVSEVFHNEGVYAGTDEPYLFGRVRVSGPDPAHGRLLVVGASFDPIEVTPLQLISGTKSIMGWWSGTPTDSEDTLRFAELSGVRPMVETYPLEKAAEGYARMMSGNAQFRVVLTM